MQKRGSRIHAVVELVCDQDELLSERVSTKLVRTLAPFSSFVFFALEMLTIITHLFGTTHCSLQVHAASGRTYNTSFDAPKEAGLDDVTGEPLEYSGAQPINRKFASCSSSLFHQKQKFGNSPPVCHVIEQ
jgi:hypothetical protein